MSLKIKAKDDTRQILMGTPLILTTKVLHKSRVNPEGTSKSLTYTWSKDGITFGTEEGDRSLHGKAQNRGVYNHPVFRINHIRMEDAGLYECNIANAFGEVETTPILIEVVDVSSSSMFAKNLITNGNFREGNTGWMLLDGTLEMKQPYFWDPLKKKGTYSVTSLAPLPRHIGNNKILPHARPGDRALGNLVDRGDGVTKISQDIDLTPIANVIDRKVEGISSVDIKLGAWFLSKEFNTRHGKKYSKITDSDSPNWNRGLFHYKDNSAFAFNGNSTEHPFAAGNVYPDGETNNDIRLWTHLRTSFIRDTVKLSYIFVNSNGEEIETVELESVPSSYTRHLNPFRQRRMEIPEQTRKIKIVVEFRRDGTRPYDYTKSKWHQVFQAGKLITCGIWGMQARIYVNEERLDDINRFRHMWKMPPRLTVHPSFWSLKYIGGASLTTYHAKQNIAAIAELAKIEWPGDDDARVKSFMGAGTEANGGFGYNPHPYLHWVNGKVQVYNYFKAFDGDTHTVSGTWTPNDGEEGPKIFHLPCYVRDAALSYLNVKATNLQWLLDRHLLEMDHKGLKQIVFKFAYPDSHLDEIDVLQVLKKRRSFIIDKQDGVSIPNIKQVIRYEDFDNAILKIHANTADFNPLAHRAGTHEIVTKWGLQEREKLRWTDNGGPNNKLFSWTNQLMKSQYGTGIGQYTNHNISHFMYNPWDTINMEKFYENMITVSDERFMELETGSTPVVGFSAAACGQVLNKLKINDIYHRAQIDSSVPKELWDSDRDNIKKIIIERTVQWVILTMIRDWIRAGRGEDEYTKRWRAIIYSGSKLKNWISVNNYYTID
jgi:hypothetical protein